jgi:putative DNA primase/helicase
MTEEFDSPELSDDYLALVFAAQHEQDLRFVPVWGKWLRWDGTRWKEDTTLAAFDLARKVVRVHAIDLAERGCNNPNAPKNLASAKTVAAVEKLARADQHLACATDIWDRDPWLLNTPGGVADLRTGDTRPHDRSLHMRKITTVAPGGDCPRWLEFLDKITAGNDGLAAFLQRIAGYSLTGITHEHAMFFGYGTGGNGKGVFLNTLTGIWGDYAAVAPAETFLVSRSERHPTDVAMLRGVRFVTAQEIEDGQQWAESKIKSLTGGDPITARFMRQDFFTYVPEFKLFVAGNHKPSLRTVDPAVRRRLNLLPFTVQIPNAEQDRELPEKLKLEWPGILQWAISGCLDWQQNGLQPPPCVMSATEKYLEAEDAVLAWLEDCCAIRADLTASKADVRDSWSKWCQRNGQDIGGRNELTDKLHRHGFEEGRVHGGKRIFRGFAINGKICRTAIGTNDDGKV